EPVEEIAADGDVARELLRVRPPFGRNRLMAAVAVLVCKPAKGRVARVEGFALGIGGDDQPMPDCSRCKAAFNLGGDIATRSSRAVLLDVIEEILVRRAEQRTGNL